MISDHAIFYIGTIRYVIVTSLTTYRITLICRLWYVDRVTTSKSKYLLRYKCFQKKRISAKRILI